MVIEVSIIERSDKFSQRNVTCMNCYMPLHAMLGDTGFLTASACSSNIRACIPTEVPFSSL